MAFSGALNTVCYSCLDILEVYTVAKLCCTVAQIWPKPFWFIEPYQHMKFNIVRTQVSAVTVGVVAKLHVYNGLYLIILLGMLELQFLLTILDFITSFLGRSVISQLA